MSFSRQVWMNSDLNLVIGWSIDKESDQRDNMSIVSSQDCFGKVVFCIYEVIALTEAFHESI